MAAGGGTQTEPSRRLGVAFWRLWTASSLSNLADGTLKVSLPLVAIRFTDSPMLISGLAFALMVPWLLFALPAGALADRLDRRRAMLGANTVRAAVAAVLALTVLFGLGSIWVLYAAAACLGTAETIYDTSAQSMLPLMLPRDRLSRANGRLFAAELTANEFIGPPLGGFLVAAAAAGSLLGSLVAERVERRLGRARSLTLTIFGNALLLGAPAVTANPFLVGAAFLVGGTTNAVWNVITVSLRQRITPDRLLGRLNSAYRLVAWGTRPLGAVAGGVLAQLLGLRAVFAITAPLALALVVGMTRVTDAAMDAAEREVDER